MKRFLLALAVVSGLAVSALPARADTLAAFINTPTTISDPPLTFTGIQGTLAVTGTAAGSFNPANILVTADGAPGLRYNGAFNATAGTNLDVSFSYVVHAAPGTLIEDNSMTIVSGGITQGSTASIIITESVFSDAAHMHPLANTLVAIVTGSNQNFDQTFFAPTAGPVYVVKDISLVGGNGVASFSVMTQDFSLVNAIPEPSTIAMAFAGVPVLGLVWARRRRNV